MDMAKMLSGRKIQPGTEKFGKPAHDMFMSVMAEYFPDAEVIAEPRFLKRLGLWALIPDFAVTVDNKTILIEIKRQGDSGNAHERLYKFYTNKIMSSLTTTLGSVEYPVYAVLCDGLASNPRYRRELEQQLYKESFLLWNDYEPSLLVDFLNQSLSSDGTFDLRLLG